MTAAPASLTRLLAVLSLPALLQGCQGTLTGLDAKSEFQCKAAPGVPCTSMTGIYDNMRLNNLPGQLEAARAKALELSPAKDAVAVASTGVFTPPLTSGMPLRANPLVLRVWLAPWEDTDGDLHDQSYVYLAVDSGRWLIEHNRKRIADAYRPVRPPAAPALGAAAPAKAGAARSGAGDAELVGKTAMDVLKGLSAPGSSGRADDGAGDKK